MTTTRKPAGQRRKSAARGAKPTKPSKTAAKPFARVQPRPVAIIAPPVSTEPGAPMTGPYHDAKEFFAWMAPIGPVQCEELFLRDPRWPRPVVGEIGGKRMWITSDSLNAHARIMRERWPERERIAREREALRVARAAARIAKRDAERAARALEPKARKGRRPKKAAATPPDKEPAAVAA